MLPAPSAFCSLNYGSGTTGRRAENSKLLVTAEVYRQLISFATEEKTLVVASISFRMAGISRTSSATPKPTCRVETFMLVGFLLEEPLMNSVADLKLLHTQRLTPCCEANPSLLEAKSLRLLEQTI